MGSDLYEILAEVEKLELTCAALHDRLCDLASHDLHVASDRVMAVSRPGGEPECGATGQPRSTEQFVLNAVHQAFVAAWRLQDLGCHFRLMLGRQPVPTPAMHLCLALSRQRGEQQAADPSPPESSNGPSSSGSN